MKINLFYKKCSGFVTIWFDKVAFHFFPKPKWQWGYEKDWYDGPLYSFGLGPLLLICWND